jgi:short-subunit dehydrogenase
MARTKTALVTGAAGDIGANVAERLCTLGYKLILIDVNENRLNEVSKKLPESVVVTCDLTDRDQLRQLRSRIENDFGPIDLAFINAGVIFVGNVLDLDENQIDLQLELNLRSAIHLIKACASNMAAHGSGHIISTVSMGGIVSLKGSATYSASKFGLRGFMTGICDELRPLGINVTGIYPSGVDTQMLRYEALNGGSNLNFVSPPLSVDDVGKAVIKAIKSKRLEVYLPYSESISARLVSCFPWIIHYLYPLMEWIGKRGLKKYLTTVGRP